MDPFKGANTGISGGGVAPAQSDLSPYGNTGYRQDTGDPYTMVNGVSNTNMLGGGSGTVGPRPTPMPSVPSLSGLQAATGAAPAAGAGGPAAGMTVPVPPPVTSGFGDGGMGSMDNGIDRILGAANGGQSMQGLRAGIGQRQPPMDSYVLAGRKVY
jgi:hypothetical protein